MKKQQVVITTLAAVAGAAAVIWWFVGTRTKSILKDPESEPELVEVSNRTYQIQSAGCVASSKGECIAEQFEVAIVAGSFHKLLFIYREEGDKKIVTHEYAPENPEVAALRLQAYEDLGVKRHAELNGVAA